MEETLSTLEAVQSQKDQGQDLKRDQDNSRNQNSTIMKVGRRSQQPKTSIPKIEANVKAASEKENQRQKMVPAQKKELTSSSSTPGIKHVPSVVKTKATSSEKVRMSGSCMNGIGEKHLEAKKGKVELKDKSPFNPKSEESHPKFGRQNGPESKAMYKARSALLVFSDQLASVKCSVRDALCMHESAIAAENTSEQASRPSSSRRMDKSRLRKLQLVLVKMSDELDGIALQDAQARGKSLARSSITDWPTKQANETRRIRKKCAGTIEELLRSIETAFAEMRALELGSEGSKGDTTDHPALSEHHRTTQQHSAASSEEPKPLPEPEGSSRPEQKGRRPRPITETPPA
jgi:hypothetical protein